MHFSKPTIKMLETKGKGLSAKDFTQRAARAWMRAYAKNYTDTKTGEVNSTELAEACADAFDVKDEGGPLDDETHWIWEEAAKAL